MNRVEERLASLGTKIPDILLPNKNIDLSSWAVIACDQFTQDRAFWDDISKKVGNKPSLLSMIFPEIYLEDADKTKRIENIRASMQNAIQSNIFDDPVHGMIYIERSTPFHPRRRGLILALDLEQYDWHPEARLLIRATEGTVPERLPPRIEIRRGAPLESPHIIVLIDDPECTLIEGIGAQLKHLPPRYSTNLMANAGSIQGWVLDSEESFEYLADHLERLARQSIRRDTPSECKNLDTGSDNKEQPFLYAVGDGNHSLATAKAVWEEYKAAHAQEPDILTHPARYALVEIENIYDEGIDFEPIHRLLFGTNLKEIESMLQLNLKAHSEAVPDLPSLIEKVTNTPSHTIQYGLVSRDGFRLVRIPGKGIATAPLQPLLDSFVSDNKGRVSIDYIHGDRETAELALQSKDRLGILLPPVGKEDLFQTVGQFGPLPRKSFSMGEGIEKRFYLECRRLFV